MAKNYGTTISQQNWLIFATQQMVKKANFANIVPHKQNQSKKLYLFEIFVSEKCMLKPDGICLRNNVIRIFILTPKIDFSVIERNKSPKYILHRYISGDILTNLTQTSNSYVVIHRYIKLFSCGCERNTKRPKNFHFKVYERHISSGQKKSTPSSSFSVVCGIRLVTHVCTQILGILNSLRAQS